VRAALIKSSLFSIYISHLLQTVRDDPDGFFVTLYTIKIFKNLNQMDDILSINLKNAEGFVPAEEVLALAQQSVRHLEMLK